MVARDGMTKAELVEEVARSTQLTKKHAEIIVNTVFESTIGDVNVGWATVVLERATAGPAESPRDEQTPNGDER